MGRKITDFIRYASATSTYPYGNIKDDTGINDGTPVNELTNADIHQFFQHMGELSGIEYDGLPDNKVNGFQYFQALQASINGFFDKFIQFIIGSSYDNTKMYIIYGSTLPTEDGVGYFNGSLYFLRASSLPFCFPGFQMQFLNTTEYEGPMPNLKINCAPTGTGLCNFADAIRLDSIYDNISYLELLTSSGSWGSLPALNANWSAYIPAPQIRKDGVGKVSFRGAVQKSSGAGSDIVTLPVGFRPTAVQQHFTCSGYNGTVLVGNVVMRVLNTGELQCLSLSSIDWVDLSGITFYTD